MDGAEKRPAGDAPEGDSESSKRARGCPPVAPGEDHGAPLASTLDTRPCGVRIPSRRPVDLSTAEGGEKEDVLRSSIPVTSNQECGAPDDAPSLSSSEPAVAAAADATVRPGGGSGSSIDQGPPSSSSSALPPTTTTAHMWTRLSAAASEDKGSRQTMEDVHVISLDTRGGGGAGGAGGGDCKARVSFFGVWDGHGGRQAAAFASQRLHDEAIKAGLVSPEVYSGKVIKPEVKGCKRAVLEAFKSTDEALLKECQASGWTDGACAVCCWVVNLACLVANVGDAKAVLARISDKEGSRGELKAVTLTRDHLALHAGERSRIEKAGGFVSAEGRLNGKMQVSRSFGDLALKKAGCSAIPDIQAFEITDRDRFLLLGCDGFWGVWDGQGAVDAASSLLAQATQAPLGGSAGGLPGSGRGVLSSEGSGPGRSNGGGSADPPLSAAGWLKGVTNRLLNLTVRERGAKDNCTVLLVVFGT